MSGITINASTNTSSIPVWGSGFYFEPSDGQAGNCIGHGLSINSPASCASMIFGDHDNWSLTFLEDNAPDSLQETPKYVSTSSGGGLLTPRAKTCNCILLNVTSVTCQTLPLKVTFLWPLEESPTNYCHHLSSALHPHHAERIRPGNPSHT